VLNAIYVPVSLYSQTIFVSAFNGLIFFSDWSQQVQFHLGVWILIWFSKLRSLLFFF